MKPVRATRISLGVLLILHGLAHTTAGYWATGHGPLGISTALWMIACLAFVGAGFGVFGVTPFRIYWRPLVLVGAVASILLLAGWSHPWLVPGLALDAAFVAIAMRMRDRIASSHKRAARIAPGFAWVFLAYLTALIALQPWYTRWGTSAEERRTPLIGDSASLDPRYLIDYGITIRALPEDIWPWMLQLGQDHGGFYSYDRIERLFGARIHNADRVHEEWQQREPGDQVLAVPVGYLGGIFGDSVGWRISALDHNRVMVFENWGTFALRPGENGTTRLLIRTLGSAEPSIPAILFAPVGLLLFEPAHFIMERGMLLGINARAEQSGRTRLLASQRTRGT